MAVTKAIESKGDLNKAIEWMQDNAPEYSLLYKVLATTGLRVTDVTEIKYSDIDADKRTLTVIENKGTKARITRAKSKVCGLWADKLLKLKSISDELKDDINLLDNKQDILNLDLPEKHVIKINADIESATAPSKTDKVRVVTLDKRLIKAIKKHHKNSHKIDDTFLFSKRLFNRNKSRDLGESQVISRQSVRNAIVRMQDALGKLGTVIKSVCHGMRKTFARSLYLSSGKDMALVMQVMGWSDETMVLRYLSMSQQEQAKSYTGATAFMSI